MSTIQNRTICLFHISVSLVTRWIPQRQHLLKVFLVSISFQHNDLRKLHSRAYFGTPFAKNKTSRISEANEGDKRLNPPRDLLKAYYDSSSR